MRIHVFGSGFNSLNNQEKIVKYPKLIYVVFVSYEFLSSKNSDVLFITRFLDCKDLCFLSSIWFKKLNW